MVVGKVEVVKAPVNGVPVVGFNGSAATSTAFRLASEGPVMTTPAEFRISKVKPVFRVVTTGIISMGILMISGIFVEVRVGPPDWKPQSTVSSVHVEPAEKKDWDASIA